MAFVPSESSIVVNAGPHRFEDSLRGGRTALLVCTLQREIISSVVPPEKEEEFLQRCGAVVDASREAGIEVIYVVLPFACASPKIGSTLKTVDALAQSGVCQQEPSEIHPAAKPQPQDLVVVKPRISAFYNTDLQVYLQAKQVKHLVIFGLVTTGVVLSTVRYAADADYRVTVVSDCCAGMWDDAHRILMEKVFPMQAHVLDAESVIKKLREQQMREPQPLVLSPLDSTASVGSRGVRSLSRSPLISPHAGVNSAASSVGPFSFFQSSRAS